MQQCMGQPHLMRVARLPEAGVRKDANGWIKCWTKPLASQAGWNGCDLLPRLVLGVSLHCLVRWLYERRVSLICDLVDP